MPSTFKPIVAVLGDSSCYDIRYFQPTAAQTFKSGDFVIWNSAGTIDIAAAAGNAVGATDLIGMSLGSAADTLALTDTKARRVPVLVPRMQTEWVLPLVATTAEDTATLSLTDLDNAAKTDLDLFYSTNSRWVLSADTATNPKFRIVGLFGEDERNNSYGTAGLFLHVKARPLATAWRFGGIV